MTDAIIGKNWYADDMGEKDKGAMIMLDSRFITFLRLCETKSYTQTAKLLDVTQPSVTQHIKYLEEKVFHCKLFRYEGKRLELREETKYLYAQVQEMVQKSERILAEMDRMVNKSKQLRFGCMKDFGESVVPAMVGRMMAEDDTLEVSVHIDNSANLVSMLAEGKLDFILIDSCFARKMDDSLYKVLTVGHEGMSAYVSAKAVNVPDKLTQKKLMRENLLIREEGAATRAAVEHYLSLDDYDLENFVLKFECNTPTAIKQMIASGAGITFAYDTCMQDVLEQGRVRRLDVDGFAGNRDIVLVYCLENLHAGHFTPFFRKFKTQWEKMEAARK